MTPAESQSRRISLLGSVHLFGGLCFFVFGLIYWIFVSSSYMLASNCVFGVLCFLNWRLHLKFHRYNLFSASFLIVVYAGLVNVVVHLGVHDSPLVFWGMSILVAAAYIYKSRGIAIWLLLSLGFLPLCMLLKKALVHRAIPLDTFQTELLHGATYVGLGLFLGYTYLLFQRKLDRALGEIEQKKAALEAAHAELEERVEQRTADLAEVVEQLHDSELLLEAIVENIPDMLFLKDAKSLRFVRLNRAGEELLGYSRGDLLGKSDYDFFPREEADFFTAKDRDVIKSGELLEIPEEPIATRHQGTRTLRTKKVPIRDAGGNARYLLGISEDITDRLGMKEANRALESRVQEAHRMESLGLLAGGIAHDFNNLLVVIYGNMDLALEETDKDSPIVDYLTEARTAGKRAADLIDQMLAYAGKGSKSMMEVNLNEMVQEMAGLLRASVSKKTTISVQLDEGVQPILGDATQLRQILMNLITNSAQSMGQDGGKIEVKTSLRKCDRAYLFGLRPDEELPEGDYISLQVSDSGPGMDAEVRARIFEPFFTTKVSGSGLGLAAVHGIVRGHRGGIGVQSEPGQGATFTVILPAIAPMVPRRRAISETNWCGSGTILVVDDEELVRSFAMRVLKRIGFSTLEAPDGKKGINLLKEHQHEIRCVLLDSRMPVMNGTETLREIRALGIDIPVVLCSGYSEGEATTEELSSQGLTGFIKKPYTPLELRKMLQAVLE